MSCLLICSPFDGQSAPYKATAPKRSKHPTTSEAQPPIRFSSKKTVKKARPPKAKSLNVPVPSRTDALISVDSTHKEHRVEVFTDVGSERGAVRVTLSESQAIEIVAFNILGKRVAEVYSGEARAGMNTVSFDLSGLSDGVYICVVRGRNFKTAEKFLVSR
jgi:hypothetical protein